MRRLRLGDFCSTGSGSTPARDQRDRYFTGGTILWIKSGELRESDIYDSEEKITTAALQETAVKMIPTGALLLAMYGATVGRLAILRSPATTNQAVCHIVPDPRAADSRYLFHALRRAVPMLLHSRVGGAQPNISQSIIKQLEVPLPPLNEQKRIAAILDAAEALREKRQQAIACVESLTAAVFRSLFGDQDRIGGTTRQLGDVAEFYAGATLPEGTRYVGQEGGCLLAKVSDLNLRGNEMHLHRSAGWLSGLGPTASTCPAGGVIIPKRGGAIATNKKRLSTRPTVLDPNLMGIVGQAEKIIPEFLYQWFLLFDLASITSGSSVPQLNKKDLHPLDISLPPLADQERFAKFWGRNEQLRTRMEGALVTTERACSALQHRAFRGEL